MATPPLVTSISYGFPEYMMNQNYITRFNIEGRALTPHPESTYALNPYAHPSEP